MIKGQNRDIAILDGDLQVEYGELKEKINQFSNLIQPSEYNHIAIFAENRLEWIYAFYAIWKTNNIPVPIDHLSGIDEVAFILNDCRPSVIFCSREKKPVLINALQEVNYKPDIIVLDDTLHLPNHASSEFDREMPLQQTAVIIYTSGTTGSPKGVMLSFENLIANMKAVTGDVEIYTSRDRVLMLLPLHHIFPLLGSMIMTLYIGGTIVVAPSLNADDIIATLQKHQVTMIIGVPRLYHLIHKGIMAKINQSAIAKGLFKIARRLQSRTFSKRVFGTAHKKFGGALKYMVSGGAPLDPTVAEDFYTLGFEILEGYGMTESAPMITFTRPGNFCKGSAGQVLPGTSMDIRDGEIVAKGKNIMQGYYNRPEETNSVLKDGWLYTGDLGRIDKQGRLFITGRKKEIIVLTNGKNINPVEIESKITKLSREIKEVAVFMMGDRLNLIIVPDDALLRQYNLVKLKDHFITEVLNPYNERVSASNRIYTLHISPEELPKTRLSKIQRFKLPEMAENLQPKKEVQHEKIDSPELQTIVDFISDQIGRPVYPEDHLTDDLAIDSLTRITLIVYLENTFGVKIDEQELIKLNRIRDLSDHIIQYKTRHQHEIINWAQILKQRIAFKIPKAGVSFTFTNLGYRTLLKSIFRIHKEGESNIPDGPCIIAPNHQSFLDGFIVAASLRMGVMRKTYFYAKEKHWRSSFRRFLARKNNVILMDLNKDLMQSLQKMAEILRKGKKIIIFPEGTRSKTGEMTAFKQTFAILARELNVPVVPVAINGAHKAMPVGSMLPRLFKKVTVQFLQPVYPEDHSYTSLKNKIQDMVAKKVMV
ncbi:MAG: AMP-binding protein [Bacteroidetes bacterium]|jgi:long-chain acyl-CoA synthetase|nr:AMP-binding protein [Bacteroidota bacterium]